MTAALTFYAERSCGRPNRDEQSQTGSHPLGIVYDIVGYELRITVQEFSIHRASPFLECTKKWDVFLLSKSSVLPTFQHVESVPTHNFKSLRL
jgi:hypothetical protein